MEGSEGPPDPSDSLLTPMIPLAPLTLGLLPSSLAPSNPLTACRLRLGQSSGGWIFSVGESGRGVKFRCCRTPALEGVDLLCRRKLTGGGVIIVIYGVPGIYTYTYMY